MKRRLIAVLCVLFAPATGVASERSHDEALAEIVAGTATGNPLAGAVLAVKVGDRIVYSGAAGCAEFADEPPQKCLRKLKATSKVRVASISKMATAMAALSLAKGGDFDLDRDISSYLGWTLRNPAFPDAPITARQLMTHLSSLRDPEEYWLAAPGEFRDLVERAQPFAAADPAGSRAPGDYFAYANINYGVLATAMEIATGDRFDRIVSAQVLGPLGVDGGFNWSGVSAKARRNGAALYRAEGGRWMAQTDAAAILNDEGPYFLKEEGLAAEAWLAAYTPGSNATLFSPQGGLRASVLDLLKLLDARGPIDIAWRFDPKAANGDTSGGLYPAAGLGVLAVKGEGRIWPGAELVGHSGEAYGLLAGLWRVGADPASGRSQEVSFAYAVTGSTRPPARGAHAAFFDVEEPILRLAMEAAAEAGVAVDDEPRPFGGSRDAMADVDAALNAAMTSGRHVLLILGGDWCHDSRSFAAKVADREIAGQVVANYEVVFVDVGRRDRNLGVPKRFGVHSLIGTPTVLVLSADGELLNADSVSDWRNAADRTPEDLAAYLSRWSGQAALRGSDPPR